MARVVGIEQNYDIVLQYCQEFRKAHVYSHGSFTGNPPSHTLIRCFDDDAVPKVISRAVSSDEVRFITGSGHGTYRSFTGQRGVLIWNTVSKPPKHVAGTIVHLLSCRAGGLLGLLFVQHGAAAFWGYTTDFKFFHEANPPNPLTTDQYAKSFIQLDAIIDIGILNGYDAARIHNHLEAEFRKAYGSMIARSNGAAEAAALLDNFVHLVSPGRTWGDPGASLSPT